MYTQKYFLKVFKFIFACTQRSMVRLFLCSAVTRCLLSGSTIGTAYNQILKNTCENTSKILKLMKSIKFDINWSPLISQRLNVVRTLNWKFDIGISNCHWFSTSGGGGDTLECWRLYKMKLAKFDNRIEPKFVRAGGGSCALFKRLLSRAKNLSQMRSFSHLQPKAKYNYWLIGFILVGQKYQKVRKNQ